MIEKVKKYLQSLAVILVVMCMAVVMAAGVSYVKVLRDDLRNNGLQNLMTVTVQQQQAFDNFIAEDRERLHGMARFFTHNNITSPEDIRNLLTLPNEPDAIYLVMCLDEGWVCGTSFDDIRQLDEKNLALYRSLGSSGVRDAYTGLYSGTSRFGYYETFYFSSGHKGLIQKSYDRSKTFETFSLSFYSGKGMSHIVNQNGDILLRPANVTENLYDNIFDALDQNHGQQEDIDRFVEALQARDTGSMTFSRDSGNLIYTYIPVEHAEGWTLVSVISENAISAETDQIFLNFQMALGLLLLLLFICAMFALLIWRAQRDLCAKDREIEYQENLFDIFATYLATNTNDVYMMLDHETEELEYISPNVERVLGVKPEDLIDYMRTSDMASDAEGARAYYNDLIAMTPGEAARSRNTERLNPRTGEQQYFLESAYCVDIQGRRKRVSYISDRTHDRVAQNSLAEALRMARAANDAKTAFLGSVSHDIRTPMNAIIGFLALLRQEANDPATVLEYTQRIDAASQHLLSLINDVLDMNKIESGSTTLNISEMDLSEVVEEINTIIRPQARAKGQTFDLFVSHLEHEHLMGDKLRLNQILINLLSNSVKYTPENGAIQLRVEELSQVVSNYSRVRFTVSDNGLGMSGDYLDVIFDPFTREETQNTRQIQGTGLGMAITKSLVDLMGGTIRVESELDKGSTFTVEVELRIQESEVPEEAPKFWNDYSVSRMIVADDDEGACHNVVNSMTKTGVVTDYTTDGEKIIEMMRAAREEGRPYDLILLDWKMPGLNGLEVARLIRKNYSDKIPILLFTAYDWSEIEEEAKEIGVNHFMPKPFFMSNFKEAIRRVMGDQKKAEADRSDVVRGMHILVVDDIEVNRIILVKILTSLGAECDTAGNGQEAVEKFESSLAGEYDLILMDVQMPVMDGYTATRTIRSSGHSCAKTLPIIAMTANAFVDDVRNAIASGMDAHISKPVQIETLKTTIQKVLDGYHEQV